MIVFDGKTAGHIRTKNREREEFLQQENDMEIYWECKVNILLLKHKIKLTLDKSKIKRR